MCMYVCKYSIYLHHAERVYIISDFIKNNVLINSFQLCLRQDSMYANLSTLVLHRDQLLDLCCTPQFLSKR